MNSAEAILNDARNYWQSHKPNVDYSTYEYYKQQLLSEGHFGYEGQLANILHI